MHIGGVIPIIVVGLGLLNGAFGVNPIQSVEKFAGFTALNFLTFSLACTPLANLSGYKFFISRRKALGNYAFLYATIHVFVFVVIDYGFDFVFLLADSLNKQFIWLGAASYIMLLPLALTSFTYWQVKLGKTWKKIHRLVYMIGITVAFHFLFASKGSLTTFSGNIFLPVIYGSLIILLLLLRWKPVKNFVQNLKPITGL